MDGEEPEKGNRATMTSRGRETAPKRGALETNQANEGWTGRNPRRGNRATTTSRGKEPAPKRGALEKHTNERGWKQNAVDYTGRADEWGIAMPCAMCQR